MKGLRIARDISKMTQHELAVKSGVSRASIARYEIEKASPTAETLLKLARALNCTVDALVGNEGGENHVGLDAEA